MKYYRRNLFILFVLNTVDYFTKIFPFLKYSKIEFPGNPKKILLINPGHIGDILISTALLEIIKKELPNTKIDFISSSIGKSIIENSPSIEKIYCVDHWLLNRSDIPKVKKIIHFFIQIKDIRYKILKENYDVAINLYRFSPNLFFYLFLFKHIPLIGFSSAGLSPLMIYSVDPFKKKCHEIEYQLSLFKNWFTVGDINIKSLSTYKPFPVIDKSKFQFYERSFILLNPISGDINKSWKLNSWERLANHLTKMGFDVIFVGKGKDKDANLYNFKNFNSINLINKTSLSELASLLHNAHLLICLDSMIAHLASAYKCKSIVISSGISNPHEWYPLNHYSSVIKIPMSCSPCYTKPCNERPCINNISVETVIKEIRKFT